LDAVSEGTMSHLFLVSNWQALHFGEFLIGLAEEPALGIIFSVWG
jgi:hypothetical protein